ncbi:MAG: hypothetical protein JO303_09895 [Caulobacteraceae bacterium]|nr:hypothetical protein [Caulobacteraceae bacterium]
MATTIRMDIGFQAREPSLGPMMAGDGRPGPVTAARLRRTFMAYIVFLILGAAPLATSLGAAWRAAGVGLWFPGAGFLADGGWAVLLLPIALALFATAVFAWFGSGMILAPAVIWLGSAALAGALAGERIWTPGPFIAAFLLAGAAAEAARRATLRRRAGAAVLRTRTEGLPKAEAAYAERVDLAAPPSVGELSREDLSAVRYALDRALQPLEAFNGYDIRDIFQTAALRYQINYAGYALSQVQTQYAPSFHGYLSLAQRNLIEKYLLRRVWDYWVYESIWGHLNVTNWDPAGKDNIMLTGYFEPQVAVYASTTGDDRYAQPGALTFRLNDRLAWRHDVHTINQSVLDNLRQSPYCLYPCEPNWIYPACNLRGMAGIAAHDMAYGTHDLDEFIAPFLHHLETEFTGPSGEIIALRSSLTGLQLPFPASDLAYVNTLNIFAPARARRRWVLGAAELQKAILVRDGKPVLGLPDAGIDFGNYRKGARTFAAASILCSSREFGDADFSAAAQNTLDLMCGRSEAGQVISYAGSNLANLTALIGRVSSRDGIRRLHNTPPSSGVKTGPLLTEAPYPDVLVARAVSDGRDLELVLYASVDGSSQEIGLSRLQPGAAYGVDGRPDLDFKADDRGEARLRLALKGRTALHIQSR